MTLLALLLGCPAPTPTAPTAEPTPDPADEPQPTGEPVEGEAGFTLDVLSLNYDIATSWTFTSTDILTYRIEGTWWSSDACASCSAAFVAVQSLSVLHCEDLAPAGPAPGAEYQFGFTFDNPGVGTYSPTFHLLEGVSCATVGPAPSGEPMASAGTYTIVLDESFVVTSPTSTSDFDVGADIVVTLSDDIDPTASAAAVVTLRDGVVTVPATVTFDGPDVRIDPTSDLESLESVYTVSIEGLVSVTGADLLDPWQGTVTTVLFDPDTLYRFENSQAGVGEDLAVDGTGGLVLTDTSADPTRSRWRMLARGTGYRMVNLGSGPTNSLAASAIATQPTMVADDAGADAQVWYFSRIVGTDAHRISVGALTPGEVIGGTAVALRMEAIGSGQIQRWTPVVWGPVP
ncbi:MAG: Ig-like domain-containing protein [Alphaproteobacteria bacterium]|nr:Ig-like domain-containing protein [Alphaproteobacteria bacterium]